MQYTFPKKMQNFAKKFAKYERKSFFTGNSPLKGNTIFVIIKKTGFKVLVFKYFKN